MTVAPMAKKDDAVSKRLAEEIVRAKYIQDRIKNPPSLSLLDLATPDQKEEFASRWSDEKDPLIGGPLIRAFKTFGLDHRNNGDWYSLALHLARILFPIRRPRGKKWTAERLFLLLAEVAAYKRKHPKASDTAICGWLLQRRRSYYADETVDALRSALRDARNPKRNSELAWLADLMARSATKNRTRAVDEAATVKAVSQVIENADVFWVELLAPGN
jgi:hypothetical protein